MGGLHDSEIGADILGERGTLRVSMSTCRDRPSMVADDPAFRRVADFQVVVEALLVEIDELEGDAHRVVQLQLALVEGVDLGGEERGLPLLQIILARGRGG